MMLTSAACGQITGTYIEEIIVCTTNVVLNSTIQPSYVSDMMT